MTWPATNPPPGPNADRAGFERARAELVQTMLRYAGYARQAAHDPDIKDHALLDATRRAYYFHRAAEIAASIPYREE